MLMTQKFFSHACKYPQAQRSTAHLRCCRDSRAEIADIQNGPGDAIKGLPRGKAVPGLASAPSPFKAVFSESTP